MNRVACRDFIVGLFVLAALVTIVFLSLGVGGLAYSTGTPLRLYANFDEIAGLKTRAPVVISGVKVGQVTEIVLNDDFRARVVIDVDGSLELPVDTSASIITSGVLGDRYISLMPGGEIDFLQSGEEIAFVESAVVLERLIGKLIHGAGTETE
ncbi:MAG: outer membrane lipid asymmetry maintenance protein MlaD [Verrucomicrobiota bacterium]|jgi:phospholipid/cholesterol/gamma-HCH transport system substrate-binding protein|nr:outer membrane lipid asymmetry maintenance protein MlaD [Verrucomicrobiota bacterium]MDI9385869.1 outer membrane lipid asymmetry maintenance protein MlaD [Verrucomicrobiota bacterium]